LGAGKRQRLGLPVDPGLCRRPFHRLPQSGFKHLMANVVVLFLGFLASLSPAWRASRYEPVEAITMV
jgi:hypothetical protein